MRLLILVWSFEKLGFQIVNTPEEADVVILKQPFDASILARNQPLSLVGKPCKIGKIRSSYRIWRWKLRRWVTTKAWWKRSLMTRIHWLADTRRIPLLLQLRETGLKRFQNISKTLMSISSERLLYCRLVGHITMCWPTKSWPSSGELMGQPLFVYSRKSNQPSTPSTLPLGNQCDLWCKLI